MQSKPVIPIVSGNTKVLGLTTPEWAINAVVLSGYAIFLGKNLLWGVLIHAVLLIVYINIISKLEENILMVLISVMKIPNIVYGFNKRPRPIEIRKTI